MKMAYENKKVFVLGMARSGYEVSKLLSQHHCQILITDQKDQNEDHVKELEQRGVVVIKSDTPELLLDNSYDVLVKNPGIHKSHPCVVIAKELGIPVVNEVEVAYHFLPEQRKIIGVTGSNGKTTTTTILYQMLKEAELPVKLGGNIGIPFSAFVQSVNPDDILILEISSHQLVDFKDFKTDISILTNITETHLDFFDSYEEYQWNKIRIFAHHTKEDLAILNASNQLVVSHTKDIASRKEYFSVSKKRDCYVSDGAIYWKEERIIGLDHIRVQGNHNYENIMAAIMVAKTLGVSNEQIKNVLQKFSGVEHRLEYVRKLNGREFYNDSKSTNVTSTQIALSAFQKPTILLMGGLDRGGNFDELESYVTHTKLIIGYGQTKHKIVEFAKRVGKEVLLMETLPEATRLAYRMSEVGDIILLSPSCASWDQFPSFEERGNVFKKQVDELE